MINALNDFCDKKSLPDNFRKAFIAYCKSLYGSKYAMRDEGETIKLFLSRMTEDQLNKAWSDFINDFKNTIPRELS